MNCPKCGQPDNYVIDTRDAARNQTRRRRECEWCGFRWTTYESIVGRSAKAELWKEIKPRLLENIKKAIVDSFKEDI